MVTVDYLSADGNTYTVSVDLTNANIPEGAYLQVEELSDDEAEEYIKEAAKAVDTKVKDLLYSKALDISIIYNDEKIQPDGTVNVEVTLQDKEKEVISEVVHFGDKTEVLKSSTDGNTVQFKTDGFSVFAIVGTKTIETTYLTADGKTLKVTVNYDEDAQIPEGAELEVEEIQENDEGWAKRSNRFANVLSEEYGNVTISDVRFLNISIMVDGEEFEPKAPVEVKIEYTDALFTENTVEYDYDEEDDPNAPLPELENRFVAVHYTENGEATLLKTTTENNNEGIVESTSITPSFSDYDIAYVYDYDTYEAGTDSVISSGLSGTLSASDIVANATTLAAGSGTMLKSAGSTPDHAKTLANNGDGTYTIGLSVTGDADTTKEVAPVNVVIVYDVSNSMTGNNIPMTYGGYGLDTSSGSGGGKDGTYFQLYDANRNAVSDGYTGAVYRYQNKQYTLYNGQRYSSNIYRADAAEKVLYDFVNGLAAYQTGDGSNVQIAFIPFSNSANAGSQQVSWTSNLSSVTGKLSNTGSAGTHKLTYSQGTNWQAALSEAVTVVGQADSDPTYVVFITDGAPSRPQNSSDPYSTGNGCYYVALDDARDVYNAVTAKNGKFFGIYAYGKETDWLASLMYYAYNNSRPSSSVEGETFDTTGYYNASSQEALEQAVAAIFNDIVDTMGVQAASIADGTTSNVSTTSGDIADLLDVNTDSFQYWLSWPVTANGSNYVFTMPDKTSGDDVTYTVSLSGTTATISWGTGSSAKTATYTNASVSSGGMLTVEWTAATDFYNFAPPAAEFTDPSVDWDLSSLGTLLDGVTYQVTFECYPTQYTLDLIADLKNGYVTYDSLDANVKKYLTQSGDDYVLATNTTASLTYTDSRTDDGEQSVDYVNPDPQSTSATKAVTISKDWSNILDSRTKPESLTMHVTRDGTDRYEIVLNDANEWTASKYISYGIMTVKNGVITLKTTGHDYSFSEPEDMTYYWELNVSTLRPMLINSVETMLVKIVETEAPSMSGENATVTSGGVTYYKLTINGEAMYYKVDNAVATLTAVNNRRSYLNVAKVIDETNAPADAEFSFNMTITNSNAANGSADDTDSDYWVWFSVYDSINSQTVSGDDLTISGTGLQGPTSSGYYYIPSGNTVTIGMKAGYNVRFLNLPTDSTYSIVESSTMPEESFTLESISGTRVYVSGTTTDDEGNTVNVTSSETAGDTDVTTGTASGTIEYANSNYTMTFDNKYSTIDVQLRKVKEDGETIIGESVFELTKKNSSGSYVVINDTLSSIQPGDTEETNPVDLGGLGIAEYRLTETDTPPGYIKLASHVDFEVYKDTDGTLKAKMADGTDDSIASIDTDDDGNYIITVINTPGTELPHTGGPGTLPYTLGGFILMISALMYGFMMRRRERRLM